MESITTQSLPSEQRLPSVPENAGRAPVPGNKEHILVVDDDPVQQMLSRLQLQKLGCDATVASSGEEALALFASTKQANQPSPFNLVLMDKVMQGLDGMTACKEILNLFPGQNIVIVSGYTPGEHADEVAQLGLSWLVKPYTIADLAKSIRSAINKDARTAPAQYASCM